MRGAWGAWKRYNEAAITRLILSLVAVVSDPH
jgi:hypothetical protein